jgi:hypothetical protein
VTRAWARRLRPKWYEELTGVPARPVTAREAPGTPE